MLTGLEMQWVDVSKIGQDGSHHLAELVSPAFISLLDHSVPPFSIYRKKVVLSALLSSSICGDARTGYYNILLDPPVRLPVFLPAVTNRSSRLLFLKLPCPPCRHPLSSSLLPTGKVYTWPPFMTLLTLNPTYLSVCLDFTLLQCNLLLHPEFSA